MNEVRCMFSVLGWFVIQFPALAAYKFGSANCALNAVTARCLFLRFSRKSQDVKTGTTQDVLYIHELMSASLSDQ